MSNVKIIKGDLFTAPRGSIIVHACNTKGVWGSGIAKQFAQKYPEAYRFYRRMCEANGNELRGTCLLIETDDRNHLIGCLFTSSGYGANVDIEEDILEATNEAIKDLLWQNTSDRPIHMCKINSGLFGVEWHKTQNILENHYKEFTVYEL